MRSVDLKQIRGYYLPWSPWNFVWRQGFCTLRFLLFLTNITALSLSWLMLLQNTRLLARCLHFSIPLWPLWIFKNISDCIDLGIIFRPLFSRIPFSMASSFRYDQYGRKFLLISLNLSRQPRKIISLSSHNVRSAFIAWCTCVNFYIENWTKSTLISRLISSLVFLFGSLEKSSVIFCRDDRQWSCHTLAGVATYGAAIRFFGLISGCLLVWKHPLECY